MSANEQNSNIIKDKSEQKANIKDEKMTINSLINTNTTATATATASATNNNAGTSNSISESIKKGSVNVDTKNKEDNNTTTPVNENKPPKKKRKKRNQETGHLSAMKNELLIAAKNKISFDPSKKVRKWVRQPIVFGTLGSTFNGSMWHSNEPKQLIIDKLINKPTIPTATINTKTNTTPILTTPSVIPLEVPTPTMTTITVAKS
ncbi:hypothetical protein U3516DRAFT_49083 [Neocallimastix sp. 'constans']|jgi:hypothetical protein